MKKIAVVLILSLAMLQGFGQKYKSESSAISFYSKTALEDISAENKNTSSLLNAATGDIVFSIPVNEFKFEKSLMQDHFNEKYLETEKYPKATFQGNVAGFNVSAAGVQTVKATGKLTIHGVTKDVEIPGTLEVKAGKLELISKFNVKLADYKVEIPQLLWQKIAEQVEVKMNVQYKPL